MTVKKDVSDSLSIASDKRQLMTKCCCLFSMRFGCFLLGYINLFFHGLQTLGLVLFTLEMGYAILGIDSFVMYSNNGTVHEISLKRVDPEIKAAEISFLKEIGLLLLATAVANVITLIAMIFCIVGLHLNRPGPIKLYLGFAISRTCITMAALFVLVIYGPEAVHAITCNIVGLCLSGYFVVVYYIYAKQLLKELQQNTMEPRWTYTYPNKNTKENLAGL